MIKSLKISGVKKLMTETEKMQQLHLLTAQGHKISAEEEVKLQNWYKTLDREESVINQNNRKIEVNELKKKWQKQPN